MPLDKIEELPAAAGGGGGGGGGRLLDMDVVIAAAAAAWDECAEASLVELERHFVSFDADGDGLERPEFEKLATDKCGLTLAPKELGKRWAKIVKLAARPSDGDGDGDDEDEGGGAVRDAALFAVAAFRNGIVPVPQRKAQEEWAENRDGMA